MGQAVQNVLAINHPQYILRVHSKHEKFSSNEARGYLKKVVMLRKLSLTNIPQWKIYHNFA